LKMEILRKNKTLHIDVLPQTLMLEDMAGRNRNQGRIGVGYGFLAPVLDLLPGHTPAKIAGVQAGSNIEKVKVLDQEFKITNWDEFLDALAYSFEKKVESISILLTDSKKVPQTKTLQTRSWKGVENSEPVELARFLGFVDSQLTVGDAEDASAGALKGGDRVLSFEGQKLTDVYALSELLQKNEKETVQLDIQRGESFLSIPVKLKPIEVQKASGKATAYQLTVSFLGTLVTPAPVIEKYSNFSDIVKYAVRTTAHQSAMLVSVVGGLFSGEVPLKMLGGPILIAKVAGESAKHGLQTFFTTLPLISINLGILNLVPIPALDGGKLFMIGLERILRRRLKPAFVENFYRVGFVMLLGMVVLATYNDLSRFWSSILRDLVGMVK